jgi:hypothetical protein
MEQDTVCGNDFIRFDFIDKAGSYFRSLNRNPFG